VVGRNNLIELYRGYGSTFFLDRCLDLRVHRSESTSSVVLEYGSQGKVAKVSHWRDYLDPLSVFAALEGR
jgi:hypothetical protein